MEVIELDVEQGSFEWLELRKFNLGASDIPVILGLIPKKRAYDLWAEILGKKEKLPLTRPMLRGKELEPIARQSYMDMMGFELDNPTLKAVTHPYMASLDGRNKEHELIVEIKCPMYVSSLTEAKESVGVRPDYYAQIQWQLMLSGAKMAHLYIYHPECDAVLKEVLPDIEFQKNICLAADAFWDLVINEIEPEKIEEVYIKLDDPEAIQCAEALKVLEEQKSLIEDQQKELKEKILSHSDGLNFEVNGIKYTRHDGRITIKYKEACKAFNITTDQLKPFSKQGEGYATWNIKIN